MKLTMPSIATTLAAATLLVSHAASQDVSLQNEVRISAQKGIAFLKSKQIPSGAWGDANVPASQPALTALAVLCFEGDPSRPKNSPLPEEAQKGIAFLLASQQPDGGIYTDKALATYNTSLALTALSLAPLDEKTRQAAIKARRFVIGLQRNFDDKNEPTADSTYDSPYNGGIGYTSHTTYSDLSNTHFALEALYYSKNLFADDPAAKDEPKLNFDAAIKFVSRCQQLKATNDQEWVSEDAANKGGFVYRPGESKVEPDKSATGKQPLRSYGSMSYAGLLSFIYADMDPKDPRITAVIEWLNKNFTLEENPGLGAQGLYYYYHTLAKALSLAKIDEMTGKDGKKINWRSALAKEMFNKQKPDGSWMNDNGRWMEKDPVLSTAYAVLTLEHLTGGL